MAKLLQLDNEAIVLASGRPGMQLRFTIDGKGEKWTDPFEMIPFEGIKGDVSSGYPGIIQSGPDSFLLIYSDFKYFFKTINLHNGDTNPVLLDEFLGSNFALCEKFRKFVRQLTDTAMKRSTCH